MRVEEEKELLERTARLEVKVDIMMRGQEEHNKRHYDFSIRSLFAMISAGIAVVIAIFR